MAAPERVPEGTALSTEEMEDLVRTVRLRCGDERAERVVKLWNAVERLRSQNHTLELELSRFMREGRP